MNRLSEIQVSYTATQNEKAKITSGQTAYSYFMSSWSKDIIELQEEFKVLLLNRANEALGIYSMSKGGVSGTVVDLKLIFAVALKCNANSIIVAHNHPSGKLSPSEADKAITKKIKSGAEILDIQFLDHLIVTKKGFFSFSSEGILI
ncbi:MAG TPA: JAB domain-containing protein [Flavobacterium sp.]|uniref:JAB domain-containing protein n=1 Tax=Flavobacterium sp. TaxID=239 RepID=UPI002CF66C55|nr:JAB domain-containing protein [Flavobacterium sp.]HNP32164.1 JAB domain-containing protein [Flavobacterium sp.]